MTDSNNYDRKLFEPHHPQLSRARRRSHQYHEIAYTLVDFGAAVTFVVGSIFFFYPDLTEKGTWLFLIGSILFGIRPTVRLSREINDLRLQRRESSA